jgi:Rps23 Pro-64 3,4-dihydroxylase Tpa1-like proline 4-hydroxylase
MALARKFETTGRVRISDFLDGEGAKRLHEALRSRVDWRQVLNSGNKVVELDRPTRAALTPEQSGQLDEAVYVGARSGFQYRYEAIRVPDGAIEREASRDILASFASFMSGGATREVLRAITGEPGVTFADAQATAYAPGDFLTGHDDNFPRKNRFAAYVLGLNPVWRVEWGGVLLMHGEGGAVEGVSPGFNTLDVFRVGQMHSVSEVTRAAAWRRYSVTGWLRGS